MQSTFLKTNVTTVKFVGLYLLAGIGGELHVYKQSSHNISDWQNLCKIKIFSPQNIYGISVNDCMILIYGGRKLAQIEYVLEPLKLNIIKNCTFSDWILDAIWLDNQFDEVALLTANNIVYKYSFTQQKTICNLKSKELCILYSGKILNTIWEELVILAGTVFQEIIIWDHAAGDVSILHRLKGHKGVIFSVNYDSCSNWICSTSDDRTVRIWSVEFLLKEGRNSWRECTVSLKVTIFSHAARVWKSLPLSNNKVISIGEDSLVSVWNENGDCINKWYGHQGGTIWSVDCSEKLGLIATGGSDGGINIWPLCDTLLPFVVYSRTSDESKCVPRSLTFTSTGNIILMTHEGKLLYLKDQNWITCIEDERFANYCLMKFSPDRKILSLGSINGNLLLLKVENKDIKTIWDGKILEGRIYSLLWLSEFLIITSATNGVLTLWKFSDGSEPVLKQLGEYLLPNCKERWITSALVFGEYILCGDRCGSIHLYELNNLQQEPIHSLRKLHGYKGVSSIKLIDGTITSAGRDGTYRHLAINENVLKVTAINKLQMEWIASIDETVTFGSIIVGFHDVYLIIWSCRENRPLLKLDCGGGHRTWDYLIDDFTNSLFITYIKDRAVYKYIRPINLIYKKTVEVGYHSKSINTASLFDIKHNFNDFIITGGEDNTLRLFSWDSKVFNQRITLHRHISSIRAICCRTDDLSNLSYVVSCGGRGQLIVWNVREYEGEVKIEELTSHMVREVNDKQKSKQIQPLPDPETRYMDVNLVKMSEKVFILLTGCSDGLFRILNFNTELNKITVAKVCSYHDHCILKVGHFLWNKNIIALTMTTEGTVTFWNINAVLSDSEADIEPCTYSLHSLGINSCSLTTQEDLLILATGSDDSTFAITVFELKKNNKHSLLTSWVEKNLHTCQITGIQILENYVISVALDQRISLLSWKFSNNVLTVGLIRQVVTNIPDIHGLLAWLRPHNTINVCIYGLGIELFKEVTNNNPHLQKQRKVLKN